MHTYAAVQHDIEERVYVVHCLATARPSLGMEGRGGGGVGHLPSST